MSTSPAPDLQMGILQRRRIEAEIIKPIYEEMKAAFGAEEKFRLPTPDGKIGHAEIMIGDSTVMLADENPQMGARSPQTIGGSPAQFMIYVQDVDTAFPKAIKAGGTETRPLKDQFYGDRSGTLDDPFGFQWTLATHVEDVAPDEMDRRMQEMMKGQGA